MTIDRTEPEFSSRISKSSGVLSEVAIETNSAVFTSLKHLQYTQKTPLSLREHATIASPTTASEDHPRTPSRSRGGTKLKEPQLVVSELFIYILIAFTCYVCVDMQLNAEYRFFRVFAV